MGKPEPISTANVNGALPYLAWVIALVSTVGSLFFSEVMGLPPCVLCWYQRVAVYPLVLIIGTGIITRDGRMKYYALPLCLAGLAVAVYHNLIYYGVIPEALTPCSEGASCAERQIEWLGFVTIPLMGLAAFAGLALCLLLYKPGREGDGRA
ncbi:MAG TPA: disulfide bond formation protein B [Pyrinomonadaceae bacterium]|nr:disulfide bond formation protein B [Pyrinomonadaceae bacterium]